MTIELTDKGWEFNSGYVFGYRPTTKPNVYVTITRDWDALPPDGDGYCPVIYIPYECGEPNGLFGWNMGELASVIGTAFSRLSNEEQVKRYLRIFHGVRDIRVVYDVNDSYGEFWVLDCGEARKEWGVAPDADTDSLIAGTVTDLEAYLWGDVWAIGYSVMPTDMDPEQWQDPDFIEVFNTAEVSWHYTEEYAKLGAEDEYNMHQIPGYDEPDTETSDESQERAEVAAKAYDDAVKMMQEVTARVTEGFEAIESLLSQMHDIALLGAESAAGSGGAK